MLLLQAQAELTESDTLFQSSPDPKAGCYFCGHHPSVLFLQVSILTRPEGRVLHSVFLLERCERNVSILTRPEGRVLRRGDSTIRQGKHVSILTRPEGRVLLAL